MESVGVVSSGVSTTVIDLRSLSLPVLSASEQELAAHEEVLTQMDKASGGKTVWRSVA